MRVNKVGAPASLAGLLAANLLMACPLVASLAVTGASPAVAGADELPIIGTYTKDQACKGDGSDPSDLLVTITPRDITSTMGVCTILGVKTGGSVISVHLECRIPGDLVILGDATFTQRDNDTFDFDDQDHTSPAVLHRCPKRMAHEPKE